MRSDNSINLEQLLSFLSVGVHSAPDIQQRFHCSQPTVSRMLTILRDRIVTIGNGRARRYTRLRDVRGLGGEFPIYKIDSEGNAHSLGNLLAVAQEEFLWKPREGREQLFRSLPWFLADLRPDGFVGRAFVRQQHQDLRLPQRISDWNEDHVLTALSRRGEDTMGNLVVGQESIDRYFQMVRSQTVRIRSEDIPETYPHLAQAVMEGQSSGSSAGGEQPKFTAIVERDGEVQNVLVKFSPMVGSEEGRRWADLLICEHHALQIVQQQAGIPVAQSRIIEAGDRVFLELIRFDRVGMFGRLPIISLRAVDNEFYGFQDSWVQASNRMENDGRLTAQDASSLRWLSIFSSLIANNDQHFGNVSLIMVDGSRSCTLAPAYDVLPMMYRPIDGAVPTRLFAPPAAISGAPNEWTSALDCARLFWDRIKIDIRISNEFRLICSENYEAIQQLYSGPRLYA
jgi:HipA-like C-terminal domain